jgi:hypothetical protein
MAFLVGAATFCVLSGTPAAAQIITGTNQVANFCLNRLGC